MFCILIYFFFFFQAEDGIRVGTVTGVQTCALPILAGSMRCVGRTATQKAYAGAVARSSLESCNLPGISRGNPPSSDCADLPRWATIGAPRSEERRVGKEYRYRFAASDK